MRNMCKIICFVKNNIKMLRRDRVVNKIERHFLVFPVAITIATDFIRNILTKKPAKIERWRLSLQNYELKI